MDVKVSALFSTFNRANLLKQALQSLVCQTLPRGEFEVIVIDDGSTDHTRAVVSSFSNLLPIKYAYQPNSGLAEGKNHGIRLATSPILIFMDDDDIASPDFLEAHLNTHQEHPDVNIAVLGHTNLKEDLKEIPLMHFVTEVGCYLFSYPRLKDGCVYDYTYFWGGRSSCKTALLRQRGIFDPVFRFGCEDIELGFRLKKSGPFRVIYTARAKSTMIRGISLDQFLRRVHKQGESSLVFSLKHQEDEVSKWGNTYDLASRWEAVKNRAAFIYNSARGLDQIANARVKEGLGLDDLTTSLLHRAYWNVIDLEKLRGSYEKMTETSKTIMFRSRNR